MVKKIKKSQRKQVTLDDFNPVQTSFTEYSDSFLMVYNATTPGIKLSNYLTANRQAVNDNLHKYAALLFRGFDVGSAEAFEQCVAAASDEAMEYKFRASPRSTIAGNVYTSTDYPADQTIFPHNEHSYSPIFPRHIYLYCHIPAAVGGNTPVGDTRQILAKIPEEIKRKFMEKGVMYVRNFGDGFGLTWQTVFQTQDKAEVEKYCASVGIEPVWKDGDRLMTRQKGPAVVRHPITGEALWFNHATFFHVTTLPKDYSEELQRQYAPMDMPNNTFYGDGEEIEPEVLDLLRQIYMDAMVSMPWQKGDVVMVDNMLAAHAREPFEGERKVMLGMAHPTKSADIEIITEE